MTDLIDDDNFAIAYVDQAFDRIYYQKEEFEKRQNLMVYFKQWLIRRQILILTTFTAANYNTYAHEKGEFHASELMLRKTIKEDPDNPWNPVLLALLNGDTIDRNTLPPMPEKPHEQASDS